MVGRYKGVILVSIDPSIMRSLLFVLLGLMCMSAGWRTDFQQAKEDAAKEHKLILMTFTGSDWCVLCRKLEKDIFDQDTFQRFAAKNLIMIKADFPKKKELDPALVKQNKQLASKYHKPRVYPFTVLLKADGTPLAEWRGYPKISPEVFISQVSEFIHSAVQETSIQTQVVRPSTEEPGMADSVSGVK